MSGRVVAFSFPDPFGLLGDLVSPLLNLPAELAGSIIEPIIEGLAGAVVGALVDLAAAIMGFFWTAAEPELQSSWFHGGPDASYDQMVVLAAPLLVTFFLAGVVQGVLRGDTAGMLRMALLRLPGAVLAMSLTVVLGDLLLDITDDMSTVLLAGFRDDVEEVGVMLHAAGLQGSAPALLLELVFAGVGLLAAVVVVLELFVRAALVYLLAAFSPLIYAASAWEPMRGSVRKFLEIALALIISKLAIAVALAVSASALVAAWPDTPAPTPIPTPEQVAAQLDQPLAQTFGVLVAAVVMFCVAAFMPFVLWRLLPLAEGAMVAQGVRSAPLRGAYTASSAAMMAMNNPATALLRSQRQAGRAGKADGAGAATAAHPAAGAAAAGASAARKGVKATKDRTARTADRSSGSASAGSADRTSGGGQRRGRSGSSTTRDGRPGVGPANGQGRGKAGSAGPRGRGSSSAGRRSPGGGPATGPQGGQRSPAGGGTQEAQRSQPSPRPGPGSGSNGRRGGRSDGGQRS